MKWRMSFATFMTLGLVALRPAWKGLLSTYNEGVPDFPVPAGGNFYFIGCRIEFDNSLKRGELQLVPDVPAEIAIPQPASEPAKEDA